MDRMTHRLAFTSLALVAVPAAMCSATPIAVHRLPPALTSNSVFRGAHRSYAIQNRHGIKNYLTFPTAIQHVVVVIMENRTPDNLFASYYGTAYPPGGAGATWGSALDLANPAVAPTLVPNVLAAPFDPNHSHEGGFKPEALGQYRNVNFGCPAPSTCNQITPTVFSYVPGMEVTPYAFMIQNYAYGRDVLQSNEGPSFVAHQYAIAGQSGALPIATSAAYGFADNPSVTPTPSPGGNYLEDDGAPRGNCDSPAQFSTATLNLLKSYSQKENANPYLYPCGDYETILDEMVAGLGRPDYYSWQYIASVEDGIWAAPMAVHHLFVPYQNAVRNGTTATQPFAVDDDANAFVNDTLAKANPIRPFAALTFVTPCRHESDHPVMGGFSDGPQWLAWLVNAIGKSPYWPTTTIIVTWDDWGGWYDHYLVTDGPMPPPFHPPFNPYHNSSDPNEWGFRVPLIVISPYGRSPGFISTQLRSQGAILNYIEATFGLQSLGADDSANVIPQPTGTPVIDALEDMLNFSAPATARPFVPVPTATAYAPPSSCPGGNG